MIPRQFAIGSIVVALTFFAAAIAGCGGGGGGATKTPSASRSPAATSSSVATATTPSLGIRELDLSKVDDVTAIVASTGGQFVQTSVIYADLTGDGVDEAIVPISSGGTMGDVAFLVLAASGHIAGVVNSPDGGKYGHWINTELPADPEAWFTSATEMAGSWWPDWNRWIREHDKKQVKARVPGDGTLVVIEDAPGSYVKVIAT